MCNDIMSVVKSSIKASGIKQYAVAERAGFTDKKFSDMLNGRYTPKACEIPRICEALGLSPNDLFLFTPPNQESRT